MEYRKNEYNDLNLILFVNTNRWKSLILIYIFFLKLKMY